MTEAKRQTASQRTETKKKDDLWKASESEKKKLLEDNTKLKARVQALEVGAGATEGTFQRGVAVQRGRQAQDSMMEEVERRAAEAPRTPSMARRRGLLQPRDKENQEPALPQERLGNTSKTVRWNLPPSHNSSSSSLPTMNSSTISDGVPYTRGDMVVFRYFALT